MTKPAIILFDWDNTLVQSWQTINEALNVTLAAMGHGPQTLDQTKAEARLSLREKFPQIFGERWEEARGIYLDAFQSIHLERLTPLPGAAACLTGLVEHGLNLGVVSNKTGRLVRREVEALGWNTMFGCVVGAGDASADKPDPAPIHLALTAMPETPKVAVWFVGDAGVDLVCATKAGCSPVLLVTSEAGILHEDEASLPRPLHRFTSFAEFERAACRSAIGQE